MVITTFPNGSDWYKANWAFRQLAADVAAAFPGDADLDYQLQKAETVGLLALNAPGNAGGATPLRIAGALKAVAEKTVAGGIIGWKKDHPDDDHGQAMYIEAVRELLCLLNQMETGPSPT